MLKFEKKTRKTWIWKLYLADIIGLTLRIGHDCGSINGSKLTYTFYKQRFLKEFLDRIDLEDINERPKI